MIISLINVVPLNSVVVVFATYNKCVVVIAVR